MDGNIRASVISLRNVTRTFGCGGASVRALAGVSLTVARGEFIAVMGPSGSGKTSLLHIMAGLDRPSSGEVHFDGSELSRMEEKARARIRRRAIGIVFQFFNLLPTLDLEENVALPLMLDGVHGRSCRERAQAALAAVNMAGRGRSMPGELSGGEMQRVAVARAIVTRPRLLLADEPTGNLDSVASDAIMALLEDLNRTTGCAVVMVTHNGALAQRADRVVLLEDGRIVGEIEPRAQGAGRAAEKLPIRIAAQ